MSKILSLLGLLALSVTARSGGWGRWNDYDYDYSDYDYDYDYSDDYDYDYDYDYRFIGRPVYTRSYRVGSGVSTTAPVVTGYSAPAQYTPQPVYASGNGYYSGQVQYSG